MTCRSLDRLDPTRTRAHSDDDVDHDVAHTSTGLSPSSSSMVQRSPDKSKMRNETGTDFQGYIVVGMQDGEAYHRQLLPLTLEETRSPTPLLCGDGDTGAGRESGGEVPRGGSRFTFKKEAIFGDDIGPKWWSPLLNNVIPPEASSTMKECVGGRGSIAVGRVGDEGEAAAGRRGGAEKRRGGLVGVTVADAGVTWEEMDEKPMVLVHTFGSGNARGVKLCGHLFLSTFLIRSSDTGLRIRCIPEGGSAGTPDAETQMMMPSKFCAQAKNHNKRPLTDILVDSLGDLPLKDIDETFLASLPRIRPVDAEGRPLQGAIDPQPKSKQRKLNEDEERRPGAVGEGEAPRKRDRLLRVGVQQVNYSEQAQDEERRQRERAKPQHATEESDSGSDDAAVAVRKRPMPKPSILTMGARTPFVTAAASAAIDLCNALHPNAFKPHFRPKAERDRWKRQVGRASLSQIRSLVAEFESYLLPSIWLFSYQSQVRGRLLAALAEATAAGVHQVVTIIARNVCPSIFRYFTPSAKPQRRHVDWEDPVPGARMNRNGDRRERHSADPRALDRHRNNRKMLKIKNKAGRLGSSGGVAGVGGRVGIDKTRRSGDRTGPIPLGLDKAEAREKRLRHLARYNRFQVAETLHVRKQASASYGEVKRMVAATWRGMSEKEKARWDAPASAGSKSCNVTAAKAAMEDGSDTHMGEHVSDADDASEAPESLGACLNGGSSDGAGAKHLARKAEETGNFTLGSAACGTGVPCVSLPRPKSTPMLSASLRGPGATDLDSYEQRTRLVRSMEEDDEDAASEDGQDEDEKIANGELAEKRKVLCANGKRRSVDQVCAETCQVGSLKVPEYVRMHRIAGVVPVCTRACMHAYMPARMQAAHTHMRLLIHGRIRPVSTSL